MKKSLSFTKDVRQRVKRGLVAASATVTTAIMMATPAAATTINPNATTESVIGGILDVIFQIAFYLGIVIAIIGVVSFILAFKDDNAEQQSRGIRLAIVGTALIGIKFLIQLTGLIK